MWTCCPKNICIIFPNIAVTFSQRSENIWKQYNSLENILMLCWYLAYIYSYYIMPAYYLVVFHRK